MVQWLADNLINIVLILGIAVLVFFVIRGMVRDRKAGRSPCGGNCASCGACSACGACAAKSCPHHSSGAAHDKQSAVPSKDHLPGQH